MLTDTTNVAFSGNAAEVASFVESILTSLAIVAGAAWAYFHYFKGRTFRERLELAVSATTEIVAGRSLLHVTTKLKNVGLSKVSLAQEGSGLRAFSFRPDELRRGSWNRWRDIASEL